MERYIDKILLSVKTFEQKFTEFNSSESEDKTPESEELKNEIFIQEVDSSSIDIIRLLSYSLLSGEYICVSDLVIHLDEIEGRVKDFNKSADFFSNNNIQAKIFEYSSAITIVVEGYKMFVQDISNKYSTNRINFLFSENNIFENVVKESDLSEKLDVITDFFFCLLGVTHIDHFPSNENEYITNLFELEKKLIGLKVHEYTDITKDTLIKIRFLKHKWKQRKICEDANSHLYLSDGNVKAVEDFKDENTKLKEWCDIIETQYELISRNWIHILETRIKPYKNSKLSELSVLQIHQLIKYYKDVKPNNDKLNEISHFFHKRNSDNSNAYNEYANIITANYSLNNAFSLFLEKNKKDIEIIKIRYVEIKKKIKGEINNFFLEYKYLSYITDFLVEKINEEDKIKYIEKYDEFIKGSCKDEIESYFLKKEWSRLNFNYVFILPFEESLVPSTVKDLPHIFYASSFVLPPSNNLIEKDYLKIKEEYDKLNLFVDTGKYFKNEIKKIEELNKELDKKDFKSIEIISIFTAIITFVLSSFPTYKFVHTIYEAVLFMLSLATALAIFITLVLFSTRDLYKKWYAYLPVIILIIVSFFGFNTLTHFEKKEIKIDKITNKKLDSISNVKIDSLLKSKDLKTQNVVK